MRLIVVGTGSNGNAYALEVEEGILLLDAGMPLIQVKKAIDWQVGKVVGCLVTHEHKDHAGYLEQYQRAGIPCYISEHTQERLLGKIPTGCHIVQNEKLFHVGGFSVTPLQLPHDTTESTAYHITSKKTGIFVYMTDFRYCKYSFEKLHHALIETNYESEMLDIFDPKYEHVVNGHCSLQTAKDFIRNYAGEKLENVILCHLSKNNADVNRFKKEMQEVVDIGTKVEAAENGKIIDLDLF